jgi:hypothetical protein
MLHNNMQFPNVRNLVNASPKFIRICYIQQIYLLVLTNTRGQNIKPVILEDVHYSDEICSILSYYVKHHFVQKIRKYIVRL